MTPLRSTLIDVLLVTLWITAIVVLLGGCDRRPCKRSETYNTLCVGFDGKNTTFNQCVQVRCVEYWPQVDGGTPAEAPQ